MDKSFPRVPWKAFSGLLLRSVTACDYASGFHLRDEEAKFMVNRKKGLRMKPPAGHGFKSPSRRHFLRQFLTLFCLNELNYSLFVATPEIKVNIFTGKISKRN